ncbi:sulfite exporter TauE/SafE family protein [Arthrobacter sp. FW306-04-A]|uniref:sulfite exporter TauE/SafE family protein n=1 Tax=Arthrobacter sp. FW306-04-A TaxID=2879619 RepID=UPI0037C01DA3|nr:sulfite exporter TauE/SafE family protein [Arthrobacter sp. FW306-04-A]
MTGALLILAVLMGSAMQRLTGLGFALVAAPFLVLLIGPVNGVILVNICGALTSAAVLARVFRHVQWGKYAILAPSALIGIIPGAVIVQYVPTAWLELLVGALVILSLTVGLALRAPRRRTGLRPLVLAGSMSGLMNTTAGVGGPALSVYAIMSRWEQITFAATMQPYFLTIGITSVTAKLLTQPSSMPQLPPWIWVSMGAAIILGLFAGEALAKRMPSQSARRLMVLLAYVGSVAAAARGIWELLGP